MKMIKINEKFVIDADENQFVLKELGTVQDEKSKNFGEETQTVLGYFSIVENALTYLEKVLLRRAIKIKDYTLKEAVNELQNIHKNIFGIVKGDEK